MRLKPLCLFLLLAFSISLAPATFSQSNKQSCDKEPFSYDPSHPDGPDNWCGMCNSPVRRWQAPINITGARPTSLPPIVFNYRATNVEILNDPHHHYIRINYPNNDNSIEIAGRKYILKQFHFHEPSEEKIDGHQYAMVIHLLNEISPENAADCNPNDPVKRYACNAVIAVLIKQRGQRKGNQLIDKLWAKIPPPGTKEPVEDVNAAALLPTNRGYYTFPGSLTTPGCDEVVTWYVLKEPIELSKEQIDEYKEHYQGTARPIQSTNGRPIQETTVK